MTTLGRGRLLRDLRDVVLVLRLLVLAGLAMLGLSDPPAHVLPFWTTVIAYGATNLGYLFFGRPTDFATHSFQRRIFLFDTLVVSLLFVLRGSQAPQFILAYLALVLMAAVVRSFEERDAARDRLQQSDRLATVGMLSAGIAHEIRSPLSAIRACLDEAPGLFDDLESAVRGQEEAERSLALARSAVVDCDEACRQLQRVASDLTSLARGAPTEPRPVPVGEALAATARLLRHRARDGARIVVLAGAVPDVLADPGRLQQVLVNLAGNGLDAMEGRGGTLTLGAENAPDGRVRLTVEDTGCGIPPEVSAHLFQPFVTTKGAGRGTGLGLHLVHEIAEAHGAHIDVETRLGVGTRVCVDWPAATVETLGDEHADAIERIEGGAEVRRAGGLDEDPLGGRRGDHPPGAREDVSARAV